MTERNSTANVASPSMMKHLTAGTQSPRGDRSVGLWIPLVASLLLMFLAAAARGESAQAKRIDRFNATLSSGSRLRIENISGDIIATRGREFSAVVTVVVTAPTQSRADELLRATRIVQSRDGNELSLETEWPESESGRSFRWRTGRTAEGMRSRRCRECKINAQYEVIVPAGVRALFHTVNGEVRVDGLDGELDVQSVNGSVMVRGAKQSVNAQSVNGKVELAMQALPPAAALEARTVNGGISVTLPKEAKFDLSASTMNGSIASTFPLPPRTEWPGDEPLAVRAPTPPRSRQSRTVIVERDGEDVVVDLKEIEREIEESMKKVDAEVRRSLRDVERDVRHLRIMLPGRSYEGAIGQGGGRVRLSTLNGSITLLAAGTKESDAKPLVSPRRSISVEVPHPQDHVRRMIAPRPPVVHVAPGSDDVEVVRGDVTGDFLATAGGGGYRIGRVSGRVKIVTQSGEIHVASAGAGAELTTSGGDITIGPVAGDLKAQTDAGDVRVGSVAGAAVIETSGGDIRIERVGTTADLRTGGGDIVARALAGSLQARTEGGDVRVSVLSRDPRGGISIRNGGGDVTLTLPSDVRAQVELEVTGGDPSETFIRSDFPEVAVTRTGVDSRASGSLNGGGARIFVRTSSGTIHLRRGPASGS